MKTLKSSCDFNTFFFFKESRSSVRRQKFKNSQDWIIIPEEISSDSKGIGKYIYIYVLRQDSGGVPLPVSNKARSKREEEQSDAKLERERERGERKRLPLVPRTLER